MAIPFLETVSGSSASGTPDAIGSGIGEWLLALDYHPFESHKCKSNHLRLIHVTQKERNQYADFT